MNTQKYYRIREGVTEYTYGWAIKLDDGRWVSNPSIELIHSQGWIEYIPPQPEPYIPTYEEKVNTLIRQKYTENDEYQLLREKAANKEGAEERFAEYNTYVEWCLEEAKKETNNE